jgi:hypothetical protein
VIPFVNKYTQIYILTYASKFLGGYTHLERRGNGLVTGKGEG